MISSACIEHLDFLHHLPDAEIFHPFETANSRKHSFKSLTDVPPIPEISDKTTFDEQVHKYTYTVDSEIFGRVLVLRNSHRRSFVKKKSSRNGEMIQLFTEIGKSCPSREF